MTRKTKPEETETTEAIAPPEDPTLPLEQNQDVLLPIKGNYCPNCEQKIRTALYGEPLCPIALAHCPRFTPTENPLEHGDTNSE